jgi:intein-encoded DNA endonuclease-like protein
MTKKLSEKQKDDVVAEYLGGSNYYTLGNKYNMTPSGILYALKQRKCPIRTVKKWMQKYTVDETFFETIDTEEKAYWLGFMFADGNVQGRQFRVGLAVVDKDHLEQFKKALKTDRPIKFNRGRKFANSLSHDSVTIQIGSMKMVADLIRHGCVPAKSLIIKYPITIPEYLQVHFIRGVFDGDGSITNSHNRVFRIAGTLHLLSGIQQILMQYLAVNMTEIRPQGNIFELKYGGTQQVLKISDWLYKDATIWLPRKRAVFEEIRQGISHGYNHARHCDARKAVDF